MEITINQIRTDIQAGETLLEAARRIGFAIPSLCYAKEAKHKSSCMVCAVKDCKTGQIIPSCTTWPTEGMQIETDNEEVRLVRTLSLELLLSDHRADCDAPCTMVCPQGLDVERMLAYYDVGQSDKAYHLIATTFALPEIACDNCKAPCEKACRRGTVDNPVAIRAIIRSIVELHNRTDPQHIAESAKSSNNQQIFHPATATHLPNAHQPATSIETTENQHVHHLTASAESSDTRNPEGIATDKNRYQAQNQFLETGSKSIIATDKNRFQSRLGRFSAKERGYLKEVTTTVSNCLHCACASKNDCKLRTYATDANIKRPRYEASSALPAMNKVHVTDKMWFEQAKCIRCGLCVYNSDNGFTFKDRGFGMQVFIPEENKDNVRDELAFLCPTGALYLSEP